MGNWDTFCNLWFYTITLAWWQSNIIVSVDVWKTKPSVSKYLSYIPMVWKKKHTVNSGIVFYHIGTTGC